MVLIYFDRLPQPVQEFCFLLLNKVECRFYRLPQLSPSFAHQFLHLFNRFGGEPVLYRNRGFCGDQGMQGFQCMLLRKLKIPQCKKVIGRAIQVQAECGELPKVDLNRIAPKHLACHSIIDPYFYQKSRGMYDVPCGQYGLQMQYYTTVMGLQVASFFFVYHACCQIISLSNIEKSLQYRGFIY